MVFPSVSAVSLREYIADSRLVLADEASDDGVSDRMTLVFIDCTWYQVHKIATDPRLSSKFC